MLDAVERAKKEGIFVLTTSTEQNYDFFSDYQTEAPFAGLGKIDPAADPDSVDNYTLGAWQWSSPDMFANSLLVPMDGRTTADMSGDTYVYYADGGWSWTVPYVAGVYALCCQVRPDMTPEEFTMRLWRHPRKLPACSREAVKATPFMLSILRPFFPVCRKNADRIFAIRPVGISDGAFLCVKKRSKRKRSLRYTGKERNGALSVHICVHHS